MGAFARWFKRFQAPNNFQASDIPPKEATPAEQARREIRKAILTIQLERKKLWQALEAFDIRMVAHMERIEEVLRRCDDG